MTFGFPPLKSRGSPVCILKSEGRRYDKSKRFLIPASAFLEFTGKRYSKAKHRFTLADAPFMVIAGFWRKAATQDESPALGSKRTNKGESPARDFRYPAVMRPLISEASITSALVALRICTVREGRPGLEHVEALLAIRGDNLALVSPKQHRAFRRGKLRVAIRAALQDGPLTGREVAERVCAAHALDYGAQYQSVLGALGRMRAAGRVVRKDGAWRLAELLNPPAAREVVPVHTASSRQ